ncbi:MAG: YihY family inner membrane protein [Cytophagales bacterium]|nr:YihY family inner membrane protein [Cytophagales bacterium]
MSLQTDFIPYLLSLPKLQWRRVGVSLWDRFTRDRLSLIASSLTFTTIMAIVPLFTVALAIFSTSPLFADLQKVLQKWLIDSLVPDAIARQVLGGVVQFSAKASRVGWLGFLVLLGSALVLVLTIDRTLNNIWRVQARRSMWKRVLVYSALLALGPMLLASSLWLTTAVVMWSQPLVGVSSVKLFYGALEFTLVWAGLTALYRFVPNTQVMLHHAVLGAFIAAGALEAAKKLLTLYLIKMPAYSVIYGAFATVPVLLLWIYMAWLVVLIGAEIAASLAELRTE